MDENLENLKRAFDVDKINDLFNKLYAGENADPDRTGEGGGPNPDNNDFLSRNTGGVTSFVSQDDVLGAKRGGPIDTIGLTTIGTGYFGNNITHSNVNLYSITGNGTGATGTVQITSGEIASVSIAATGNGYVVGDVLGITTADVGNAGTNAEITVTETFGIDTLYLTNVQGEKFNDGRRLVYYTDIVNDTIVDSGVDVRNDSLVNGDLHSGNILEINNSNHSMNSIQNVVQIDGVKADTPGILLTADINSTDTIISVANTTPFATFEGISTSAGYVQIGKEIILRQIMCLTRLNYLNLILK